MRTKPSEGIVGGGNINLHGGRRRAGDMLTSISSNQREWEVIRVHYMPIKYVITCAWGAWEMTETERWVGRGKCRYYALEA